jgi:hypothetical protein
VFAHLLDASDFEILSLQRENQPVAVRHIDSPLPLPFPLQGVAAKARQLLELVNSFRTPDGVDAKNILSRDDLTEGLFCLPVTEIVLLEPFRPEDNFQEGFSRGGMALAAAQ